MATTTTHMDLASDEWEFCNDDGFVYKRKKRRLDVTDSAPSQARDPEAEERHRRERKKKALLKLKKQYQKEINQWEYLSNTLQVMQEKTRQGPQLYFDQTPSILDSASNQVERTEITCGPLVDELLLQVEAQEAIIRDVSNLCDVAEAMCNSQEEQLKQSLLDLPVWSSPHELMALLCDE